MESADYPLSRSRAPEMIPTRIITSNLARAQVRMVITT